MATHTLNVNLAGCSIGDQGCKYLARLSGLCKCQDTHSAVLTMDLINNDITHCGVDHISTFLKVGCIDNLRLGSTMTFSGEHVKLSGRNKLRSLQGTLTIKLTFITLWGEGGGFLCVSLGSFKMILEFCKLIV